MAAILPYAGADTERPPRSRILVQSGPGELRFVDPPWEKGLLRNRILADLALQILLVVAVLGPTVAIWRVPHRYPLLIIFTVIAVKVFYALRGWRQARRYPTTITITATGLDLTPPNLKRLSIPRGELDNVRASRPRRFIGLPGRMSSLEIAAWGRRFRLLQYRDYIEMKWLARQIRAAIGRDVEHPGERAVQPSFDMQDDGEPPVGSLPFIPAVIEEKVREHRVSRLRLTLLHEYNKLGCAPVAFLLLVTIVGIVGLTRLLVMLVICLQFGRDAYFNQGLRPLPHRGFFHLNNGSTVAAPYQLLFVCLFFLAEPLCMATALLAIIGLRRLKITFCEFRQCMRGDERARRKRASL